MKYLAMYNSTVLELRVDGKLTSTLGVRLRRMQNNRTATNHMFCVGFEHFVSFLVVTVLAILILCFTTCIIALNCTCSMGSFIFLARVQRVKVTHRRSCKFHLN
eukprot:SAG31_NODE_13_length_37961_cov_21.751307_44_plen_104_part_00